MNSGDLQTTIFRLLHELTSIPIEELSLDANLRSDINLDSVSSLELLGMIDEEFNVEIDVYEVRDVKTVRDIVELAQRKLEA